MTAQDKQYMALVSKEINNALDDCPLSFKIIMQHLKNAQGKNMRAALVVGAAKALGEVNKSIIELACAVELLHLSTLVHDDIIDDGVIRRGIESVQSKFGKKVAVIAGDYLFTKCFQLVSANNLDRMEDFIRGAIAVCNGEVLQQQNIGNVNLRKPLYYKIIAGKTAAMFAMAMYVSATVCKSEQLEAERMLKAGYNLGMAFQLIDDCLDYAGDSDKLKKATIKDLEQGVITMPLIHTLEQKPELKNILNPGFKEKSLNKIVDAVRECQGAEATKKEAQIFYLRSKAMLDKINGDTALLYEILEKVYNRES